ncbi:hypothetical protein GCM10027572_04350 [Flexivirga lutea]
MFASLAALGTLTAAILSGNRSTMIMLAGVPILAIYTFRNRGSATRLALSGLLCSIGMLFFFKFILPTLPNSALISSRLASIVDLVKGTSHGDASAMVRAQITSQALDQWHAHPLFGGGIGSSQHVDSAALYLAEFGLIGTVLIAAFYVAHARFIFKTASKASWIRALVAAWVVVLALSLFSSMPTADQGLAIACSIITALSTAAVEMQSPTGN